MRLPDEKIDWQEPTGLPFEHEVGPQAVAENIFEIIDGGDIVAAIGKQGGKGAANGVGLDAEFVPVWRFGPDGKITGIRSYTDTYLWRKRSELTETRG